jgi:hypothetical protein
MLSYPLPMPVRVIYSSKGVFYVFKVREPVTLVYTDSFCCTFPSNLDIDCQRRDCFRVVCLFMLLQKAYLKLRLTLPFVLSAEVLTPSKSWLIMEEKRVVDLTAVAIRYFIFLC